MEIDVIVKPILSEKISALTDKQNKVAFIVNKAANKFEIKKPTLNDIFIEKVGE